MAITKTQTTYELNITIEKGVLHKVTKKVRTTVHEDGVQIAQGTEEVPAKRADLEAVMSSEAAVNASGLAEQVTRREAAETELKAEKARRR